MRILAIDQARHGGWALFDYEKKSLERYGTWDFSAGEFADAAAKIEALVCELIIENGADAVFFEDIQARQNLKVYKRLAQLQGVLINLCVKNEFLYDLIAPSTWQSYCMARGRTAKEKKANIRETRGKASKILSLQFARDSYGIETDDDNLSDAVCIGHYAVHNIPIVRRDGHED